MQPTEPATCHQISIAILPFGDSNTWGTGNPDETGAPATTIGYRLALKQALQVAGIDSQFVGSFRVGYATFADCATEGWPGKGIDTLIWRVKERLLERLEPDICLLLIGANDLWRSLEDRRPVGPLKALYWVLRLQRLLYLMHRHRPGMLVLIGKPVTPANAAMPLAIYRAGISATVALGRTVGARWRAVNLAAPNDGVHYTPEGHAKLAVLWCAAILATLQRPWTTNQT